MKKLLIASTALVLTTGAAAAQISFGGETRFGIAHDSAAATQTVLSQRTRLNITMSGTTDGGLSFGAFTRIQTTNTATGVHTGARSWIAANGFRLEVGNIDGAVARRVPLYAGQFGRGGIGFTGMFRASPMTHAGYTEFASAGAGPNAIRLDADFGAFGVSLSGETGAGGRNELGVSYSAGGIAAGLGLRDTAAGTQGSLHLGYTAGAIAVGVLATQYPGAGGGTNTRLYGSYTMGANTFSLSATQVNALPAFGAPVTGTAVALAYSHNLGGGATFRAAVGQSTDNATIAEVGLNLNF